MSKEGLNSVHDSKILFKLTLSITYLIISAIVVLLFPCFFCFQRYDTYIIGAKTSMCEFLKFSFSSRTYKTSEKTD
jgi:hypothetical protein